MSKLQELLRVFPEYWNTEDEGVNVLQISYSGSACWINISDDIMEIIPSNGPHTFIALDQVNPDALTYIPVQLTIGQLATQMMTAVPGLTVIPMDTYFSKFSDGTLQADLDNIWRQLPNIWTNYPLPANHTTATRDPITGEFTDVGWYTNELGVDRPLMVPGVPSRISDLGAVILSETNQNIKQNQYLKASTNLLWNILRPTARVLREAQTRGDSFARQMDLRVSEGVWLDRWGEVYGVLRASEEGDVDFRRRLSASTFKPRISPTSIIKALTEGFGFPDAHVTETSPLVLNGNTYTFTAAPFTFLVQYDATIKQTHQVGVSAANIIDLYRAAGTKYYQIANIWTYDEVVAPLESFRTHYTYVDPGGPLDGLIRGFHSIEGGAWVADSDITTVQLGSIPDEFGGKMFGEGFFG